MASLNGDRPYVRQRPRCLEHCALIAARSRLERLTPNRQHRWMPDHPEWYRAWRHDELAHQDRMARNPRYRRREQAKRIVGDALLVGATVVMFGALLGSLAS